MFYTPTPLQERYSNDMLKYQHAYLWADAGTGKTVMSMEAFRKGGYEKGVVIAPAIALTMWQEEIEKHLGKRSVVMRTGRAVKRKLNPRGADFLITTFSLAEKHRNLIRDFANDVEQSVLIIDEAHACKNKDAKRTKSIMGPGCAGVGGIFHFFSDVWQLTGTPVMRHVDDLWAQLRPGRGDILKHYNVETYDKFVDAFCRVQYKRFSARGPMQKVKVIVGSKNLNQLEKLLKSCEVIRCTLEEAVQELPPLTHRLVEIDIKEKIDVGNLDDMSLEDILRELQDQDSKLSKVRRMLGVAKAPHIVKYAVESGISSLLIGFWHKDVCAEFVKGFAEAAPNWVVAVVDGSTPAKQRDQIKDDFNAGKINVIFGQMQAMNVSWNLQELCSNVIIAEELSSPGLLHQFYSRVFRKGQQKHTHVDHCRSSHPLDKVMQRIRIKKAETNERIGV